MKSLKKTLLESKAKQSWSKIGLRDHHGIALPLSSLHSENSCGIGEYLDLISLIDWCAEIGLDVIQLLPLNDSGNDPSPYNALSSRALHPVYLSLEDLPFVQENPSLQARLEQMKELSSSHWVDYHAVLSHKTAWLRDYYETYASQVKISEFYVSFLSENPWALSYGLFKVLKDQLNQTTWSTWPKEIADPTPATLDLLEKKYASEISFYLFIQAACFAQMQEVHEYAKSKKILLKGDIPILISPDSVDVWINRHLFTLDFVSGAPPDVFNEEGQCWGFPLFCWEEHEKEQYAWWKGRLQVATLFYDLYRIDHVVGFFRIWAIPHMSPSIEGKFIPEKHKEWIPHGKPILEMMLQATDMLPIAEDLGIVPIEVRHCLEELGICGTKVLRWERNWETDRSFIPFEEYTPVSLACVSTHDSETLALWWRDLPEEARSFAHFMGMHYKSELGTSQRKKILEECHRANSLFHINLLQEYLALFPELVWEVPEQERINIPGELLPTNWTYRFRPSLEELHSHEKLKEQMHHLLSLKTRKE